MSALPGRVALVTGASSGIGRSTAIALATAGAKVAVAGRRADRLQEVVERIKANDGDALALAGDVTDEAFAKDSVARTVAHFGRLDILVNSAGTFQFGSVENADSPLWRQVMDINLMATLYTCSAAIPVMRGQGGGDIINISSTAGRRAGAPANAYCTSKFALTGMTEGMRQEVGSHGIRVCIVEPGATSTEISEQVVDPNYRTFMREHIGKEGTMKPEDIAAAILLVVSLPPRTNISQILIRPTIDVAP